MRANVTRHICILMAVMVMVLVVGMLMVTCSVTSQP